MLDIAPLFDVHDFWHNQPVPKINERVDKAHQDAPIEVKTLEEVSGEPYPLPVGYSWCNVDLMNDQHAEDVYNLLTHHYVEDDDACFRFDYKVPFLRWALCPPGTPADWIIGVRGGKKQRLFGFITGIPVTMHVNGKTVKMAEINFLCVYKDLRAKRLAPVLIKEITRRVNLTNIWQAVYTAGITLPTPVANTQYWHRSLNPKKLVEINFTQLPAGQPLSRYIKLQKLPQQTSIPGMRMMTKRDVPRVTELLNEYLAQYKISIVFTKEEVEYFLVPRETVIYSFVVEDSKTITDFFSFYSLPSSILKNPDHETLNVAYSYYNVSTTNRLKQGLEDMLVIARDLGYDVFNALDVMENAQHLEQLKFGVGDGHLHYYLYNWRVAGKTCTPQEIGLVLV